MLGNSTNYNHDNCFENITTVDTIMIGECLQFYLADIPKHHNISINRFMPLVQVGSTLYQDHKMLT